MQNVFIRQITTINKKKIMAAIFAHNSLNTFQAWQLTLLRQMLQGPQDYGLRPSAHSYSTKKDDEERKQLAKKISKDWSSIFSFWAKHKQIVSNWNGTGSHANTQILIW